jgi:cell division protein FtsB
MNTTHLVKTAKHLWHRYGTMNNIVIAAAFVIAMSWAWGSITTMQRNFALQKEVDKQRRELELTDLEVQTLQYQQNYYRSDEYKDLAAREHLGLASPGEKVLHLPPNSQAAKQEGTQVTTTQPVSSAAAVSNFDQWINFLIGGAAGNTAE